MIAEAVVHTTGLNLESIAVTVSLVIGIVGAFTTWITRQITHAINDMSDRLSAKLETKETVTAINGRLIRVEQILTDRIDQK